MSKTLDNVDLDDVQKRVKDAVVVGNGDMFRLLCKVSSQREGWMKSTKAMEVPGGCVVQVTTHQLGIGANSFAIAEALTFVPNVKIADDINAGRRLVAI
jgi:hypothetical protein